MRGKALELWVVVTSDRRKAGLLGLLALVLLVLAVRTLAPAPRQASASPASENAVGDRGLSAITLDELRGHGPIIEVAIPGGVERNVFAFDERSFPIAPQSPSSSQVESKSGSEAVESPREEMSRAELTAREVREEAGALRLKSVLMGPNPLVVIESGARGHRRTTHTLRVGDVHHGFTLVSIEAARVVLEKRGVSVELMR